MIRFRRTPTRAARPIPPIVMAPIVISAPPMPPEMFQTLLYMSLTTLWNMQNSMVILRIFHGAKRIPEQLVFVVPGKFLGDKPFINNLIILRQRL